MNPFDKYKPGEVRFLRRERRGPEGRAGQNTYRTIGDVKTEDQIALREHLDRALAVLKPGVFYRLDSVASHLAFGEYNPLNRGFPLDEVTVDLAHQSIPALEEEREKAGRRLIETFVCRRLIPLGCVRAAVDRRRPALHRTITPLRRLLRPRDRPERTSAPSSETAAKVVVQPDFSVVVIGLNPAPVAELVPSASEPPGAVIRER